MNSNPKISIYISCYNEEISVIQTLKVLIESLNLTSITWEILIIDDCSSDNSINAIEAFLTEHPDLPVFLHANKYNQGLVETMLDAAKLSKGEYFWCVAGDNPLSKSVFLTLLSWIGKADIIIPNVLCYKGRRLSRQIISSLYAFFVRLLSGCPVRYYNGSSIFKRKNFIELRKRAKGFGYSAEIIIDSIQSGHSYIEVDIVYSERNYGKSSAIKLKHFFEITLFFNRLLKKRINKLIKTK